MKKKRIKGKQIAKIAFILLIVVTLILLVFMIFKGKIISSNSSLVNELYTYLGQNDLTYCEGLSTYDDKKVNFKTLDKATQLCNITAGLYAENDLTTMKIDKSKKNNTCSIEDDFVFATDNYEDEVCTIYRIETKKIEKKYKEVYGKEIESPNSFNLNSTVVCYPGEEYYYCGLAETFTVTVGAEPETFRSIKQATEKNNKIIIYDYFIKIVNEECYTSYMGDTKNSSCTSEYSADTKINYNYLKKYGTLYKHTFKKAKNDSYYWVESEPVE